MTPTVVVGVSAGIAAYKAAILVRELLRAGCDVRVVPTPRSLDFVGRATWEGLTGRPVHSGVTDVPGADHVELARIADLIVVAPATADLLARVRAGIADDLLTTTILASHCPVLLAPAMHSAMWTNPATADNIAVLRERGLHVLDPDTGALGSGDSGIGRLPDPVRIGAEALALLGRAQRRDLEGARILVSAGGTHEPIDPVRFIGNLSSGRQGLAIARAAAARGARVVLVASNIETALLAGLPGGIEVVPAPSGADVEAAVLSRLPGLDAVVMAAAVADFRPASVADRKIKKDPDSQGAPVLVLERTTDILKAVCESAERPRLVVGFAAETGDPEEVLSLGAEKARRKGADLLAVNGVGNGRGFGDVENSVTLLNASGEAVASFAGSKADVAEGLVAEMAARLGTIAG